MELVLSTIKDYEGRRYELLKEYRKKASSLFDRDLTSYINNILEIITRADLYNVERYSRLFDVFSKIEEDNLVKQMIYEKLEQEYGLILEVQREIGSKMQLKDSENLSIQTIISILEKLFDFMYPNKLKQMPVYESLIRLADIHKQHSSIFMSIYEINIKDNYDKELFKLTDEEIIAKNAEILENSKRVENTSLNTKHYIAYEREFNNLDGVDLSNLKCSNE